MYDLNSMGNFITTVGFPIALCIIFLIMFYKLMKIGYSVWKDEISPVIRSFRDGQLEFIKTLQSLDMRLTNVETDVDIVKTNVSTIKNDVDDIKNKLGV